MRKMFRFLYMQWQAGKARNDKVIYKFTTAIIRNDRKGAVSALMKEFMDSVKTFHAETSSIAKEIEESLKERRRN